MPANNLIGLELDGEWKVISKITPGPINTGGAFSVGYVVENKNGKEAYLKALDFSKAFQGPDPPRELQSMTAAYNFERDLLEKCKQNRLKRVVTPIDNGIVKVPGNFGPLENVCYIIFEKADGDIRMHYKQLQSIDLAWCLRSLHHTATGLKQLHSISVAHQDLKPSNILVFDKKECKLTDLGRASDETNSSAVDSFQIPGATAYAPPETFYDYRFTDEFKRRFGTDMYLFGSLIFFYFADVSATHAIAVKLRSLANPNFSRSGFVNDLPYIRNAFFEAVNDLREEVEKVAGSLTEEIISIVKQLCEPDPERRGHPRDRAAAHGHQYNMERYISILNRLAKTAEYKFI